MKQMIEIFSKPSFQRVRLRVRTLQHAVGGQMLGVLLLLGTANANAQRSPARLEAKLPPSLRASVVALADSADAAGLPRAPLIDKALEGVSKGANEQRILAALRVVAANLGGARNALGTKASDDEITAGAAALRAGVASSELVHMRKSLAGRSLTVPLSVLSALVTQGVSAPDASHVVVAQAKRDDDEHLLAVGQDAVRKLASGVPPRAVMQTLEGLAADPQNYGSSGHSKPTYSGPTQIRTPKTKP